MSIIENIQEGQSTMVMRVKHFCLLCILLLSWSCGAKKVITGTDTQVTDSTIVRQVPVEENIPGAVSESPEINYQKLDSMIRSGVNVSLINAMLQGNRDPTSKMSARIQVDEKGNLKAICELQEKMIELMTYELERLRTEYTRVTVEVSKTWYQQLWHDFKQLIVGAALLLAFLTIRKFLT
ncbi:hypothetical protein [uncultured Algoriphagus sp.]|uniref:hypothetical protein n=1 Tax=uncultured Algoriphagus sp. TaxID=417365 RepID=UPI00258BD3AC|nr:hypothetical protein [uncultured Algoriphagus sp.]